MNLMSTLMARADADDLNESTIFELPPPPEI
jgi:hypothetical protein